MRGAVQPSQELPEGNVERAVALGAPDPAGFPEVAQGGPAAGAGAVQRGSERGVGIEILPQGGEESSQRGFGEADPGLDPLLCRALRAKADRAHVALDDLGEADHPFPLTAVTAFHPYDTSAPYEASDARMPSLRVSTRSAR